VRGAVVKLRLGGAVVVAAFVVPLALNASAAETASQYRSISPQAKVSQALKCSPEKHRRLIWYGGPVGDPGYVVIVYWGSWWRRNGSAVKTELAHLYDGLAPSKWQ
jgi:hypothetical protein